MPYKQFDRSKLNLRPLCERVHDLDISVTMPIDSPMEFIDDPQYGVLAERVLNANKKKSTVLMMYGAHVIRTGNALHMIELMKKGHVTHLATNGAGAIHDFELALIGQTCESVEKYINNGQFGLWYETGMINDIIKEGITEGMGFGESVGRYIWENNFANREKSVLAMGYHLGVPCTIHVGIGNDIIHEHPNCDGAATGRASYMDFLIYVESITNLEGGVFMNFGSSVTGPEVYLKALAMARNVAHQNGEKISNFTTAVFDLLPITNDGEPSKSNPYYYFRPWKTILARTVADGGESFYFCGEHKITLPNLSRRILDPE